MSLVLYSPLPPLSHIILILHYELIILSQIHNTDTADQKESEILMIAVCRSCSMSLFRNYIYNDDLEW